MNIYDEVVKALKAKGVKTALNKQTEFKKIGLDSLDLMDMIVRMENELGIQIPDEKLTQIQTIGDLVQIVEEIKGQ